MIFAHWHWPQWVMIWWIALFLITSPLGVGRTYKITAGDAVFKIFRNVTMVIILAFGGFWS